MPGPIKPDDVAKVKTSRIPEAVFEAFNELIAENWTGHEAVVGQREVVALIMKKIPDTTSALIYESRWLDVEGSYRAQGWSVDYDKPGYNETYEATFTFKRRTRSRKA